MYVCVAGNGKMLVFFLFSQQQFEWTIIFQNIGFEPYGVIFWSQGAPIVNHRLQFFKIFYVRLGNKRKIFSFSRVYVCVKANIARIANAVTITLYSKVTM